jgi:hypothetical protein
VRARLHSTRPPLDIFLWSRLGIWAAAIFAVMWLEPKPPALQARWDDPVLHDLGWATDLWAHWDSAWYLRIAEHGYGSRAGSAAFYPLYPTLVAGLGRVLAGHYVLAGVLVSLAACLGSFVLLHRLARTHLGAEGAGRAVLYLAVFPMTIFLQAVYAESLYLLLALATFGLAERRRFVAAAVAASLACLTRPVGLALLPPLALLAWRGRSLRSLLVVPPLLAVYPLVLWWRIGDPWAFAGTQELWHRHLSPAGPLGGIGHGVAAVFTSDRLHDTAVNVEALAALVLFAPLAVVAWRRFGAAYGLFAALSLAIPLSVPSSRFPLLSLPRFGVVVFPLFLALAHLGGRPRTHTAIVAASCVLLGVVIVQWVQWQWVS